MVPSHSEQIVHETLSPKKKKIIKKGCGVAQSVDLEIKP
jgi:hypothetical protein